MFWSKLFYNHIGVIIAETAVTTVNPKSSIVNRETAVSAIILCHERPQQSTRQVFQRNLRPSGGGIVPAVVYHGQERWRAATDFAGLFEGDEALRPY